MRLLKIILTILVLGGLMAPLMGCGSDDEEASAQESQVATVQRGDLAIEITAAGNLALSLTEDLAIDLFYQEGTIEEVLVEEGDTIEEGQVLVRLDTDEWNDELRTVEKALVTARRSLTSKQSALTDAERAVAARESAVTAAERTVAAKEFAVSQAAYNLQLAEYNLGQIDEVQEAQEDLTQAKETYDFVKRVLQGVTGGGFSVSDIQYWYQQEENAEEEVLDANEKLGEILEESSITLSNYITLSDSSYANPTAENADRVRDSAVDIELEVALEIGEKQLRVEQEQLDLEDARVDVEDAEQDVDDAEYALESARLDVEDARLDVEDAEQDVEDAQSDLDEARSLSSEIKASFDGFVTKVNVEGGDEVMKGTVAVQVADPNKFEAEIMVSEMDILQMELGMDAWVEVDAMSGLSLPAEVTHISPTATIQSGVVNYAVTVEVKSLEAVVLERKESMQQAMADIAAGEIPARLQQAIEEGRITREQVEEMMEKGPPAGMTPPEGFTPSAGMGEAATGQVAAAVPEDFQLRDGLTVTVTIVVEEKTDVLLVPNAAITSERGQSYVQVVTESGETEERAIQTGTTDYQFTEVTDGLSEGEQILVPQGTVTTPATTTEQGPPRMGLFGPRGPR